MTRKTRGWTLMRSVASRMFLVLLASFVLGADTTAIATWSFEKGTGADTILGVPTYIAGVSGTAMRFDGQTTTVVRSSTKVPRLNGAFSIEAWVAIQEYPWTWCAIINQEEHHRSGYFFGIDPDGRFGLQLATGRTWVEGKSDVSLSLYTWNHLVATFDPAAGIRLYLNGRPAGATRTTGSPRFAPRVDVWIGRNHTPLGLSHEVKIVAPVAFSFNGIIDEIAVHDGVSTTDDIDAEYRRLAPGGAPPLHAPELPAGPKGPGRFGAYYTHLQYAPEWEHLWRVGDEADVVVRFDTTPTRLVFWRGTSYIPAWVTENGIWYTNEFYETQSAPMEISAEPMADKQTRLSQVRILESNDARVVVLWRYAPVTVNYELVNEDALSGWGDWVDEYYTVYPDGTCVRKIKVWSSSPYVVPGKGPGTGGFRQYHEAIVINPAGTRPEDNIKTDALTIANMKGESHTYSWATEAPGTSATFDADTLKLLNEISDQRPDSHKWLTQPAAGNILRVNLKAQYSPYAIVDPRHVAIDCYAGEIIRERSIFPWWNHWPVSQQIRSNGRWAIAPDRASHSSLAHIQSWQPFERTEQSITMLMLNGLTESSAPELVPLAKSWLSPSVTEAGGDAFRSEGFDPTQRAFVLTRRDGSESAAADLTIRATAESPVVNPVLVIHNWGTGQPVVAIDGQPTPLGKDLRAGFNHRLDGDDMILWMRKESTQPIRVSVQ
jgi:concanavalin A-like lectin/glucanase superfamily protein